MTAFGSSTGFPLVSACQSIPPPPSEVQSGSWSHSRTAELAGAPPTTLDRSPEASDLVPTKYLRSWVAIAATDLLTHAHSWAGIENRRREIPLDRRRRAGGSWLLPESGDTAERSALSKLGQIQASFANERSTICRDVAAARQLGRDSLVARQLGVYGTEIRTPISAQSTRPRTWQTFGKSVSLREPPYPWATDPTDGSIRNALS